MGQGVTTGLATLIGEELDVAPAALRVEFAAVHPAYRNPVFRVQATGASTSMRAHFLPLRQAAADVRQLLLNAAAQDLGVAATDLHTDDGHVLARDGERLAYGRFIATAATLELPSETRLKPREQWKYIGRPFPRLVEVAVDVVDKVTRDWVVAGSSVDGLHGDYDLPNRSVRHVTRDHGLPVLFWRSVGHSYTAFAKESAVDALARASGIDPVELRLRNTRGNPRLAEVVRIAGERMKAMRVAPGRGLGLAAHGSYESYVAEVSVAGGAIRVHKVLCVVDCGLAVNPDVVRAQVDRAP